MKLLIFLFLSTLGLFGSSSSFEAIHNPCDCSAKDREIRELKIERNAADSSFAVADRNYRTERTRRIQLEKDLRAKEKELLSLQQQYSKEKKELIRLLEEKLKIGTNDNYEDQRRLQEITKQIEALQDRELFYENAYKSRENFVDAQERLINRLVEEEQDRIDVENKIVYFKGKTFKFEEDIIKMKAKRQSEQITLSEENKQDIIRLAKLMSRSYFKAKIKIVGMDNERFKAYATERCKSTKNYLTTTVFKHNDDPAEIFYRIYDNQIDNFETKYTNADALIGSSIQIIKKR